MAKEKILNKHQNIRNGEWARIKDELTIHI